MCGLEGRTKKTLMKHGIIAGVELLSRQFCTICFSLHVPVQCFSVFKDGMATVTFDHQSLAMLDPKVITKCAEGFISFMAFNTVKVLTSGSLIE